MSILTNISRSMFKASLRMTSIFKMIYINRLLRKAQAAKDSLSDLDWEIFDIRDRQSKAMIECAQTLRDINAEIESMGYPGGTKYFRLGGGE